MKMVVAFINPDKLWEVKKALYELGAPGISVGQVMGIGKSLARMGQPGEGMGIPKFFPKMRLETVVEDSALPKVLDLLREVCNTDTPGDGKVFVLPVEDALRIRTNERGEDAIL